MTRPFVRVLAGAVLLAASLFVTAPSAHKSVLSPYTFHRDVAPILRARCGSCHAAGANASPLTTYAEVKAGAIQVHDALISGRMPIWFADAQAVPFKGSTGITARELDTILTWAAGGTPEGVPVAATMPAAVATPGAPAVVLEMPKPFTLAASQREAIHEVTWPAGRLAGRWVQTADVIAGTPSIARRATIEIRSGNDRQVIAHWTPGDIPHALPGGGAFRVPNGASIVLRLHYAQPSSEAATVSDRSRVAFYVSAPREARPVGEIRLEGGGDWPFDSTQVFTQSVSAPVRLVAIRPLGGALDGRVALTLVGSDGRRTPLATLVLKPEWPRRYVFDTPIPIAAGSRIEAAVTSSYGLSLMTLTGDRGVGPKDGGPLRILIETIQ